LQAFILLPVFAKDIAGKPGGTQRPNHLLKQLYIIMAITLEQAFNAEKNKQPVIPEMFKGYMWYAEMKDMFGKAQFITKVSQIKRTAIISGFEWPLEKITLIEPTKSIPVTELEKWKDLAEHCEGPSAPKLAAAIQSHLSK
jgi:hypothetical protein